MADGKCRQKNTALTASAFQDHLNKSLGLNVKKKLNISTRKISKDSKSTKKDARNKIQTIYNNQKQEYVIKEIKKCELSLAEKFGLISIENKYELTEKQWFNIKRMSNIRQSSSEPCSICKDVYEPRKGQVLLSCSHVFHRHCIFSFEKYSGKRECPICRCKGYEKRVIYEGENITLKRAAIKIQSLWRGYVIRKKFISSPKNASEFPMLRKKYFIDKFFNLAKNMQDVYQQHDSFVNEFINEIDVSLATSKSTMDQFDRLTPKWDVIQEKAIKMDITECPICLSSMKNKSKKKSVLLSCSHTYHLHCLVSYEKYCAERKCPVCREVYTKMIYEIS